MENQFNLKKFEEFKKFVDDNVMEMKEIINKNGGKIPQEWKEILPFIVFALKLIKFFTNEKTDKIIDEIIFAIKESS